MRQPGHCSGSRRTCQSTPRTTPCSLQPWVSVFRESGGNLLFTTFFFVVIRSVSWTSYVLFYQTIKSKTSQRKGCNVLKKIIHENYWFVSLFVLLISSLRTSFKVYHNLFFHCFFVFVVAVFVWILVCFCLWLSFVFLCFCHKSFLFYLFLS